MPSTLTLKRSGDFVLRVEGDSHCGVYPKGAPPRVPCSYDVEITCALDSLDDQGFLVEQIGVDDFFKSMRRTTLSCERLVIRCARDLHEKIMAENPRCKIVRMKLTISPQPKNAPGSAGMTLDWDVAAEREQETMRILAGGTKIRRPRLWLGRSVRTQMDTNIIPDIQVRCLLANIPEPGWKCVKCSIDGFVLEYSSTSPYGTKYIHCDAKGLEASDVAGRSESISMPMVMFVLYLWQLLQSKGIKCQ